MRNPPSVGGRYWTEKIHIERDQGRLTRQAYHSECGMSVLILCLASGQGSLEDEEGTSKDQGEPYRVIERDALA